MQRAFALLVVLAACAPASGPNGGPEPQPETPPAATSEPAPSVTTEPTAPSPSASPPDGQPRTRVVAGTDKCTTDADCVPAGCCHPASCVARAKAPACADVMCTMNCQQGTMDCGGGCLCQDGTCAARIVE